MEDRPPPPSRSPPATASCGGRPQTARSGEIDRAVGPQHRDLGLGDWSGALGLAYADGELYAVTVAGKLWRIDRPRRAAKDDRRHGRLARRHRPSRVTLNSAAWDARRNIPASSSSLLDATAKPRSPSGCRRSSSRVPTDPGVYLMKDRKGRIIYVGKAANLKARVRSYFNRTDTRDFVPLLGRILGDIETVVVNNEKEALLLENNLIKQHQPRFNVKLRDDKNFLVLRLDPKARFPRLEVTRRIGHDGANYFGPYHSATSCRATLAVVNRHFKLRTCTDHVLDSRKRPCLQYQIKRCDAPCVYPVTDEEYGKQVQDVALFLEGKDDELLKRLRARMKEAARDEQYEIAAAVRDQIDALEQHARRAARRLGRLRDQDVFGFYREGELVEMVVLSRAQRQAARAAQLLAQGAGVPDRGDLVVVRLALLRPRHVHPRRGAAARGRRRRAGEGRSGSSREARASAHGVEVHGAAARAAPRPHHAGAEERGVVVRHAARQVARRRGGAGEAAAAAEPQAAAAAHRVLRHLAHPGHGDGGVDGDVPRRRAGQGRVPHVQGSAPRTTTSRRCTRCCRAASAAASGRGAARRASRRGLGHARPPRDRRRQGAARAPRSRRCATRRSTRHERHRRDRARQGARDRGRREAPDRVFRGTPRTR